MPVQRGKSNLFSKIDKSKLAKAHAEHKDDEATFGNPSLPEGIENGVAQLVQCKFGEFKEGNNKGKPFFMAAGVVKHPAAVNGVGIVGLRTQIGPEPLCDTPSAVGKRKTFEDHYAWMLNQLRILGVDTKTLEPEELEATASALTPPEGGPFFKFRTWKGNPSKAFPNPRVNHEWNGVCEYNENGDAVTAGVEDSTVTSSEPNVPIEELFEGPGQEDLDVLAVAAEGGDEKSQQRLTDLAKEAGVDDDAVAAADNWVAVVTLIQGALGAESVAETEPEKPWEPAKEEIYAYKPVDPKTKKRGKAVQVKVLAVDKKSSTVTILNLVNKAQYKGVKWDDLEEAK